MMFFKRGNKSRKRTNQKTERRYDSNVASNVLVKKPRGRRLKGDRRKVKSGEQEIPPVMARVTNNPSAGLRLRQSRTLKRRFDLSLGVAGAEARLPSLPVVKVGWRFVSGIMLLLMVFCLFNVWNSPAFKIDSIQVEGVKRLTQGDVNTVLGIIGESIFLVSPSEMEENLMKAFPELISAEFQVALPAEITVYIDERDPILSLIYDGTEYWVDMEGVVFNPRGNPGELIRVEVQGDLPVLEQNEDIETELPLAPRFSIDPELVTAVRSIGETLPESSLLLYDKEHGLGWYDPDGWQVYFGLGNSDIEMKLKVYNSLVENLVQEGVYPSLISVEHVHAPYFRMEQ